MRRVLETAVWSKGVLRLSRWKKKWDYARSADCKQLSAYSGVTGPMLCLRHRFAELSMLHVYVHTEYIEKQRACRCQSATAGLRATVIGPGHEEKEGV